MDTNKDEEEFMAQRGYRKKQHLSLSLPVKTAVKYPRIKSAHGVNTERK